MHKKAVSVGSRMWMRMSFSRLFRGFPINSVCLIQNLLGFWKRFLEWFYLLKKLGSINLFLRKLSQSLGNQLRLHHCWKRRVLITTLLHPTDPSLICLFCPTSQKGLFSTQSRAIQIIQIFSPPTNQLIVVIIPLKRLSQKCIQTFLVQPMMVSSPSLYC